jgi:hypothetical protein
MIYPGSASPLEIKTYFQLSIIDLDLDNPATTTEPDLD